MYWGGVVQTEELQTRDIINREPGAIFSKLPRKILARFLILGQSLTVSGKTLTRHEFALLTNSRFNNNVTYAKSVLD